MTSGVFVELLYSYIQIGLICIIDSVTYLFKSCLKLYKVLYNSTQEK